MNKLVSCNLPSARQEMLKAQVAENNPRQRYRVHQLVSGSENCSFNRWILIGPGTHLLITTSYSTNADRVLDGDHFLPLASD